MPPEDNQCSQHFYAHDESIRQNKADIEKIFDTFSGLPTDIKHILEGQAKINEFIGKLDEKYVSKEHMALKMETLEDKMKLWVIGGAGTCVVSAVMFAYYASHLVKP